MSARSQFGSLRGEQEYSTAIMGQIGLQRDRTIYERVQENQGRNGASGVLQLQRPAAVWLRGERRAPSRRGPILASRVVRGKLRLRA